MYRRIVYATIDSISEGLKTKPVQEAVRRILKKYRINDERIDKRISGIVYNVFRWYGLLEHIVDKNLPWIDRFDERIKTPLILATYINLFDEKISNNMRRTFNRYIIKYICTRLRVEPGISTEMKKYIKRIASLDKWIPRDNAEEIMYRYRVSVELYDALEKAFKQLGENHQEFLEYTLNPPPRVFRVNTLKASRNAILKYLSSQGLRVEPGRYSSRAIRIYGGLSRDVIKLVETGILVPQDESSMIAVELLDPKPGTVIADLCAAPGGKTTYLAEYTGLKSIIHSFEIYRDRAKRLRLLIERTGTGKAVRIHVMDARRAEEVLGRNSVDYVLLDPPCTSTGALARNPDVRWRFRWNDMLELVKLQEELLEACWRILRRKGRLIYTVCSVLPWEGEYIVKKFLEKHVDAKLLYLDKPFTVSPILPGTVRAYPHKHDVIGFYYALILKE